MLVRRKKEEGRRINEEGKREKEKGERKKDLHYLWQIYPGYLDTNWS